MARPRTAVQEKSLFGDPQVAPAPKLPAKPAKAPAAAKTTEVSTNVARLRPETRNLLEAIVIAAADPKCQPDKMHALLDARDRLMAQEARVQFMAAYIAMQAELPTINAKGRIEIEAKKPGGRKQSTPYATYHEINRVTKPILGKHKFALLVLPDVGPNGVGVLMRGQLAYVCDTAYGKMVHAEHCAIAASLETSGSKNSMQGVGSSLSYTKRYAAVALLNLVSEASEDRDDDGAAADGGSKATVINPEQAKKILADIADANLPMEMFICKYGKVEELKAAQFDEAARAVASYKARMS